MKRLYQKVELINFQDDDVKIYLLCDIPEVKAKLGLE